MKDTLEILNKVTIDLTEYTIEDLNDVEKAKLKYSIRKQIKKNTHVPFSLKKQWLAACLALGILGLGSTATVATMNILGYDFEYLFGVDEGSFKDYKTVINEVVYDHGIHVKLNEVIVDNTELMINTTFQFDEAPAKENETVFLATKSRIYINGKLLNTGSHGSLREITDTQFISTMGHPISLEALPEGAIHIKIIFSDIRARDGSKVYRGQWKFEFDTNRDQLLADLKNYDINKSFIIEDLQQVDILNVELTKIATVVHFKTNSDQYEIQYKVEDDLGNIYNPCSATIMNGVGYERLEAVKEGAKQLRITPYYAPLPEGNGKGPDLEDYTLLTEEQIIINLQD